MSKLGQTVKVRGGGGGAGCLLWQETYYPGGAAPAYVTLPAGIDTLAVIYTGANPPSDPTAKYSMSLDGADPPDSVPWGYEHAPDSGCWRFMPSWYYFGLSGEHTLQFMVSPGGVGGDWVPFTQPLSGDDVVQFLVIGGGHESHGGGGG